MAQQQKIELPVEKREILGKGVRKLRNEGIVPGVLYGHNFESIPVQVDRKSFDKIYKQAGESTLVYIDLDGKSYPTIIYDVVNDAIDGETDHVDFYKVRLDEKITAEIQLVFVGESPAVKNLGGILVKNLNQVEVKALPQNLPHELEIDISNLAKFEQQILVSDLKISSDVEMITSPEEIIALIQEPISEAELEADLAESTDGAEADVEVIGEAEEESTELAESPESSEKVSNKEE